jgi:hypothetical protein
MSLNIHNSSSNSDNNTAVWLASAVVHPLDVGIVFSGIGDGTNNNCGHRLKLSKLTLYLDEHHHGTTPQQPQQCPCPICQTPIGLVIDGVVAAAASNAETIYFKYGKLYYRLSMDNRSWFTTNGGLAQRRIANVLHMKSLKILHKGKVLYPNSKKTNDEISQQLLDLSSTDTKPHLVVMGTRVGHELKDAPQGFGIVVSWIWMFNSWMFNLLYSNLQWVYYRTLVFVRPMLLPRPPPPSHRD